MEKLLIDAVVEIKNKAKSEESFMRDLSCLVDIYTQSVKMTVANNLLSIANNPGIPDEVAECVREMANKSISAKSFMVPSDAMESLSENLARLLYSRSHSNWGDEKKEIRDHYTVIANKFLIENHSLIRSQGYRQVNRMYETIFSSIRQVSNELLSDDDINEFLGLIARDIHLSLLD